MRRILPHPVLSLALTAVWVLLANDYSLGSLVIGAVVGLIVPALTRAYWPDRPRIGRPLRVLEYFLVVQWDIVTANLQVAWIVLTRRNAALRPAFVSIPLDLKSREAVTVLAGTITMTPGTVSADLSADGRSLLVHCLDVADPSAVVAEIKARYEARLLEIFG